MKLTEDDKFRIYEHWKATGDTIANLAKLFNCTDHQASNAINFCARYAGGKLSYRGHYYRDFKKQIIKERV